MGYCEKHNPCRCDCKEHKAKRKRLIIISIAIAITIAIAVTVTTIMLTVHPTNLSFSVHDLTLDQFNLPSPNTLTISLHLSIYLRNPTSSFSLSYDSLRVYVSYHCQQITPPTLLPATFLSPHGDCLWSPFLYGANVPVTPYLCAALAQDQAAGYINIEVKIDGRLKWKLGKFFSGSSNVHVSCPATVPYGGKDGGGSAAAIQFLRPVGCSAF